MTRRSLTDEDRAAWAGYIQRVRALPGESAPPGAARPELARPAETPPETPPETSHETPSAPVRLRSRPDPVRVGAHPAGVDNATWTRFRTGKLPTMRTLDLHGRTAQAAYGALHVFLRTAHAEGARCVEVITGRGQGEGGVIRRELPHWLNAPELRPLVLAASHPHAANPGSVRVLLRRVRGR